MTEIVIKAENLARTLQGEIPVTLVKDASIEIEQGQFVVITGPSGSGKSSLLYLLGLLDKPDRGKIWLNGELVSEYSQDRLADVRLREIGFVFQFHFLLPEFTAFENVMLPMQKRNKLSFSEMQNRSQQLLADLGLENQMHKLPKQLSGGQSQRVAIARSLANNPEIILADEPTGNLDSAASRNVEVILKDLAHNYGRTVVVVTHETRLAENADRVINIVDGKIEA